eukprot:GHVL01003534.1.p1 GENE.GHVL01003534.1~~GHVL01003534.1.p1  ORF type:complete len:439 (+),score=33.37 GHVL01003534.1:38-1354(+)
MSLKSQRRHILKNILCFAPAAILRLILILYGNWQDENFVMKYTDVDYYVFSDAAYEISKGGSPFDRHTYRYPPVLAWILLPNVLGFPSFGKYLFATADMVVGVLIHLILRRSLNNNMSLFLTATWLYNPVVINISSRGSSDSLTCCLIIMILYLLKLNEDYITIHNKNNYSIVLIICIVFGLAVHVRIYPVIYGIPILISNFAPKRSIIQVIKNPSVGQLFFAIVSASIFFFLTFTTYFFYGFKGLYESLLYHFLRTDHRQNLSPFWYLIYLSEHCCSTRLITLLSFVPQWIGSLSIAILFCNDAPNGLPLALFLQTIIFVSFNRVCTAQYFVWWLLLLPLALAQIISSSHAKKEKKNTRKLIKSVIGFLLQERIPVTLGFWLMAELNCVYWAYRLEHLGEAVYLQLGLANLLFLLANLFNVVHIAVYAYNQPKIKNE